MPKLRRSKEEAIRDGTLVMPFGKHKDKTVEEIPSGYLWWMVDKLDPDDNEDLIEAAENELEHRTTWNMHFEEE